MKFFLVLSLVCLAVGNPVPDPKSAMDKKDKKPLQIFDGETGTAYDYQTVASRLNANLENVPKMKLDGDNQTPAEDRIGFLGPFGYSSSFYYNPFLFGFGGPFGGFGGPGYFGGPFGGFGGGPFGGGFGGPGFGGPGFGGPGFGGPGIGGPGGPPPSGGYGGGSGYGGGNSYGGGSSYGR